MNDNHTDLLKKLETPFVLNGARKEGHCVPQAECKAMVHGYFENCPVVYNGDYPCDDVVVDVVADFYNHCHANLLWILLGKGEDALDEVHLDNLEGKNVHLHLVVGCRGEHKAVYVTFLDNSGVHSFCSEKENKN